MSDPVVGMIVRESEPENLESPFSALDGLCTPNDQFYVRSHFPVPAIAEADYRLSVEGFVEKSVTLSLADLKKMPATTSTATLECAGNNRIFMVPQVRGAQWGLGAVSTAEWTGVSLAHILELAGVKPDAVEVVFEGGDRGKAKEQPAPPGEICYARSIPLAKAGRDVMLAYAMNGETLTPSHGFPLRAIVPEWYGMASVKWLTRIVVIDREFQGYFQTTDYAYWTARDGTSQRIPITEIQLKAQIARPAPHEVVPRNSDCRIFGTAWSGATPPAKVEVSTDGGKSYAPATLLSEQVHGAWRLWEYRWRTPSVAGPVTLMARATDVGGHVQPAERDPNWGTYVICHVLPIPVTVR